MVVVPVTWFCDLVTHSALRQFICLRLRNHMQLPQWTHLLHLDSANMLAIQLVHLPVVLVTYGLFDFLF